MPDDYLDFRTQGGPVLEEDYGLGVPKTLVKADGHPPQNPRKGGILLPILTLV